MRFSSREGVVLSALLHIDMLQSMSPDTVRSFLVVLRFQSLARLRHVGAFD